MALSFPVAPTAQASSTATASVSVSVVDPGGVGQLSQATLATASKPELGTVRLSMTAAAFAITGREAEVVSLEVSNGLSLRQSGGVSHLVAELTTSRSAAIAGSVGAATREVFLVGGSMQLSSRANPGLYEGTIRVIANYN